MRKRGGVVAFTPAYEALFSSLKTYKARLSLRVVRARLDRFRDGLLE